jgi:hypothetical protein
VYRPMRDVTNKFKITQKAVGRSRWQRDFGRGSAATRLLGLRVRIPPRTWTTVTCSCGLLSSRGICGGLITRREKPTECGASEYDRETSILRRPWP